MADLMDMVIKICSREDAWSAKQKTHEDPDTFDVKDEYGRPQRNRNSKRRDDDGDGEEENNGGFKAQC